jgi:hypothetical protein
MESGFSFKLYETEFTNCCVHISRYANGNLHLSLIGIDPDTNEMEHIADISLEQNKMKLKFNEVIVDYMYKDNFITQLKNLGIIKKQTGVCAANSALYPIYSVDFNKIVESRYSVQELIAA